MGIMERKYLHEGETPDDFIPRVAGIFSEDLQPKAKEVLENCEFIPAGRTLYGAGYKGKRKVSTSNCYICPTPEDNIESIFETAKRIARISSYGGGCGVDISKLRPKGAKVNNSALTSTGAVSFLNIFDVTGATIGQKGRRAALMIGLDCSHPDIEEFLKIKQNNEKLASMNISIKFTNEFMEAVKNGEKFKLHFDTAEEHIEKYIDAREFFMEFCRTQWDYGDPGALFIDRIRSFNLLSGYKDYHIDITNPCVTGDTVILTKDGYKKIIDLVGKDTEIWNGYEWSTVQPRITGHNQKMLRVTMSNDVSIDCTRYHKFILHGDNRVKAEDLKVGDVLETWYIPNPDGSKEKFSGITIASIEEIPDAETVYCFTEPKNHSGIFNGIMTAQCAEFSGNAGNSCNLGSVNLYMVIDDKFTDKAHVNFAKLKDITRTAVRMLDEVLDYGYDMQPLDINRKCIDDWRSIGLGVFGLADALVAMGIRYGSPEARMVISDIMEAMLESALDTSADLAAQKGTFGKYRWVNTKKSPLIEVFFGSPLYEKIKKNGLRNGTLLSVAPTGSISLFAGGFTGGVEPMYQVSYERTTHSTEDEGKTFRVYARGVKDLLAHHHLGNLSTEEIKKRFPFIVESHEIPPMERIAMQGVMQDYVDNAISSTINLPHSATPEEIFDIYMNAWQQGLKGVTVFRDGCKRGNILGVKKSKDTETPTYNTIVPAKRRDTECVKGATFKESSSCVPSMYVTVNRAESGDIFEVFTNASGGCQANINTITRLISLCLRSGIKVDKIVEELRENKCPACQMLRRQGKKVSLSCANAIADAIDAMRNTEHSVEIPDGMKCPECGKATLRPDGHCISCSNCGWSKCD